MCVAALVVVSARVMRAPAATLGGSTASGGQRAAGREISNTDGGDPAAPAPALALKQSNGGGVPSAVAGTEVVLAPAGSPSRDGRNSSSAALSFAEEGQQARECPPCEALFRNLDGAKQHVSVILRGVSRPKMLESSSMLSSPEVRVRTQSNHAGTRSTVHVAIFSGRSHY